MDLEHLTKHQLLLLTLLVSFVTSIATGIVTVSLVNQAPPGITRVVNQIVERTVETVAPSSAPSQGAAASTATTVVVRDDDLAAQSIAQVQKSVVRFYARGGGELVARGFIVDRNGLALTDRAALAAAGGAVFDAVLSSGERVPAVLRTTPSAGSIAYLDIVVGTSTGFEPAKLGTAGNIKLGQSVIRIGGAQNDTVNMGVIASTPQAAEGAEQMLEASVEAVTSGSLLLTLFGEVVGMTTAGSKAQGAAFYTVPALPSAN